MGYACPSGHTSAAADYCDTCGERIDPASIDTSSTPKSAPCPRCGTPRAGRDRYCEDCGFDFTAAPAAWSVVVLVDAEYFARLAPQGLNLPASPPSPRTVVLDGSPLRIGRGDPAPDIDLTGDPGVSRLHASLVRSGEDGWAIVDEGSSNGTSINDDERGIAPHVLVPLRDGDRIHIGAWTTLAVKVSA